MVKASARHIRWIRNSSVFHSRNRSGRAPILRISRSSSSCPSRKEGGELGEFGPGMMVREFDEVVFSAELNAVQGPVKTQFGYHLLEVTSRSG